MKLRRAVVLLMALALAVAALGVAPATAQTRGELRPPSVTLDRADVTPGQRVLVTLHDWPLRTSVNIVACGNLAKRGSRDCNLSSGQGLAISEFDSVHLTEFLVPTPPVPCPCVIRVANARQDVVALARVGLTGFPSAPVVGSTVQRSLVVTASVSVAPAGLAEVLRSSVGGPKAYDLTVTVRNRSDEQVGPVRLAARAGRSRTDQARIVDLPAPGRLAPGQSWTTRQQVKLAAPVIGTFLWYVTASGAGPAAKAETSSTHRPLGLVGIGAVLIIDIAFIAVRKVRRKPRGADVPVDLPVEQAWAPEPPIPAPRVALALIEPDPVAGGPTPDPTFAEAVLTRVIPVRGSAEAVLARPVVPAVSRAEAVLARPFVVAASAKTHAEVVLTSPVR